MKFPTPPPREESEAILPLVNVVFLLIIFFMLAGAFANPDLFRVTPPDSSSENPARIDRSLILLAADGRLAYAGRELDLAELQNRIAAQRSKAGGELPPLKLKADARVQAERLIEVMQGLKQVGVERLSLLTLPPES